MELSLKYLKKTKGGRMENVRTFKAYCKKNQHVVPTTWLNIKKTIKTPESEDIFGHVAIGNMLHDKTNVIVKVYEKDSIMLKKELSILRNLTKHNINNIVRLICHLECSNQNKLIWKDVINEPRELCSLKNGKYDLYFLVMEYLSFGNIGNYFSKNILATKQFISFVKQCILCLIELYDRFGLHHGDLHSGNILIDFSNPKTYCYKIQNTVYEIQTFGCEPVFIDFGRASKSSPHKKQSSSSSNSSKDSSSWVDVDNINWTLQEAILLLEILQNNTRNIRQKEWIAIVSKKLETFNKNELAKCAEYVCSL
jgi:serine/threonine protein kinase